MRPSPPSPRTHLVGPSLFVVWIAMCSCDASARQHQPPDAEPATPPSEQQRAAVDELSGTYTFVGGQTERDAVLTAIDDVVADMNILARGIARDRLREANPVPDQISIHVDGDDVAIAFDDRQYTAPLDGSKVSVEGISGDPLQYRVALREGRLTQHFVGDRGGRVNTIKKRGGKRLRVKVKVSSNRLPKALEYSLTLSRAP